MATKKLIIVQNASNKELWDFKYGDEEAQNVYAKTLGDAKRAAFQLWGLDDTELWRDSAIEIFFSDAFSAYKTKKEIDFVELYKNERYKFSSDDFEDDDFGRIQVGSDKKGACVFLSLAFGRAEVAIYKSVTKSIDDIINRIKKDASTLLEIGKDENVNLVDLIEILNAYADDLNNELTL